MSNTNYQIFEFLADYWWRTTENQEPRITWSKATNSVTRTCIAYADYMDVPLPYEIDILVRGY